MKQAVGLPPRRGTAIVSRRQAVKGGCGNTPQTGQFARREPLGGGPDGAAVPQIIEIYAFLG